MTCNFTVTSLYFFKILDFTMHVLSVTKNSSQINHGYLPHKLIKVTTMLRFLHKYNI